MIQSINDFQRPFFVGIAGAGMSAIAQYLKGIGKEVAGSDRFFKEGETNEIKDKLEAEGYIAEKKSLDVTDWITRLQRIRFLYIFIYLFMYLVISYLFVSALFFH